MYILQLECLISFTFDHVGNAIRKRLFEGVAVEQQSQSDCQNVFSKYLRDIEFKRI